MRFKILVALIATTVVFGQTVRAAQSGTKNRSAAFGESETILGPDDVIEVYVYNQPTVSGTQAVRPDGKITIPLAGEIAATGKSALQLQAEIATKLGPYVKDPVVNIVVKEVNSAKVSVLGEVKNPGVYKISTRATVLDAIAMAGGFTEYAKRSKVTVIRTIASGEQKRLAVNVDQLVKNPKADMFYVLPYDKIYVQ